MKNFFAKIWNTPFLHGLLMALISAVLGAIFPIAQAWLLGQSVPTLLAILAMAGKVGAAGVLAYLMKNGFIGSSATTPSGPGTVIPPVVKMIVLLFALSSLSTLCSAQAVNYNITSPYQMLGIRGTSGDTVTNTGVVKDSFQLIAPYQSASFLVTVKKISGTVSPTLLLQGSVDGLNWATTGQDTLSSTNSTGTVTFNWQIPGIPRRSNTTGSTLTSLNPNALPFLWYRVQITGTGTMAAIVKAWVAPR